ncbi:NmrA family NAD(P)-binding protein [Microbacterium paludicola]|uniref:NmrA family NAD(P)-binding protein n=1 Tax=Microbacterium paludicola TaxID=300019 RepID=UPI0031DB06EB
MSIAVTGASGRLGSFVIDALVERGVSPTDIVAITRTPEGVRFRDRAVTVRQADYDDPESLDLAFRGVERLLLVAGTEIGRRLRQHRNVIAAAKRAWVGCMVYTSMLGAETEDLAIAREHRETERELDRAGIPTTILRNGPYLDTYMERAADDVARGEVIGGSGRVSAAHRRDYAEAAAAAILTPWAGRVYELGGEPFGLVEYARELSRVSGRQVAFRALEGEALRSALVAEGLPADEAAQAVELDAAIARGALETGSSALAELSGRRPTTLAEAVDEALVTRVAAA